MPAATPADQSGGSRDQSSAACRGGQLQSVALAPLRRVRHEQELIGGSLVEVNEQLQQRNADGGQCDSFQAVSGATFVLALLTCTVDEPDEGDALPAAEAAESAATSAAA